MRRLVAAVVLVAGLVACGGRSGPHIEICPPYCGRGHHGHQAAS